MAKRTSGQVFDLSKIYLLYDKDGNRVVSFTDDPDHVRGLYNSNPTLIETSSVDTGANTNVTLQRVIGIPDDHERQRFSENQGTVAGGIVSGKLLGVVAPYHAPFDVPVIEEVVTDDVNTRVFSATVTFRNVPEHTVLNLKSAGEISRIVLASRTPLTLPYTITEGLSVQFSMVSPGVASALKQLEIQIGNETVVWTVATTPYATRTLTQEVGKTSSEGYLVYLPAVSQSSDIQNYTFFADHGTSIFAETRPGGVTYSFLQTGEHVVTVDAYPKTIGNEGKRTVVTCTGTPHISSDREIRRTDTRLAGIVIYRGVEKVSQDLGDYLDINGGMVTVNSPPDLRLTLTQTSSVLQLVIEPRDSTTTSILNNEIVLTQGSVQKTMSVEVYPRELTRTSRYHPDILLRHLVLNAGMTYWYDLSRLDWALYANDGEDHLFNELTFGLQYATSTLTLPDNTRVTLARYALASYPGDTHSSLRIRGDNEGNANVILTIRNNGLSQDLPVLRKPISVRDIRGYTDPQANTAIYRVPKRSWVDVPVPENGMASAHTFPDLPPIHGLPAKIIYGQDGVYPEFTNDGQNRVRIDERDPVVGIQFKDEENDLNSSPIFQHVNRLSDDATVFAWPRIDDEGVR